MQSCSPITRGLTSPRVAPKRRFAPTRSSGVRRLGALRRVDTPEDLLGAAKSGLDVFMKRASKALPIILGADEDSADGVETAEKLVQVTREDKAAALNRARVESLLKADAGRDDIFHAAGQGLTGISGDITPTGWWDSSGVAEASPELELQALNDDSRAQLVGAVLVALRETLENIEENDGSLRDLIQNVARISANDWMNSMSLNVGSQVRCARVVQVSGEVADESIWKNGEILEGSKTALYASVLMYLAKNSPNAGSNADDVEIIEKTVESVERQGEPVLEFFSSPMASVCVSVLQDLVLNIADSVATAYVTSARESSAQGPVNGGIILEEDTGAIVRIPPFREALSARLRSTRLLEKFRNAVALRSWLEQHYYDVIAMYEDWHKLRGINESGELVTRKIHVCRQPELQKVKGFRLAVSMFVELTDVGLPLFRSALNNFSRVASWLLVTLIGRSLGLIYKGIRESVDPQNRVKFT